LSLDTTHALRTSNTLNRHVGDLGNITTDANGTVTVNMHDWIIQFFIDNHTTGYDDVLFLK
jgi:Cu/Zn superoxide dismutase